MAALEPTASSRRLPPADGGAATAHEGGVASRYHSLFTIGKGGMGTVEVALERGSGGFERIVALKQLLPEGARDPRHKEMFLREARLAALLAHPNVVHAFAFGDLRGELFLAMEYVEGEPLSRILAVAREKEGGLAPAIVAHILAEVCDGLHAAHELRDVSGNALNVVHRDVSPHNVMIAYEGHVKLLDFGVAKFDLGKSNTKTGEVKGKMAYMSPEQALGDPLDRRSDLFSVGAVLFECIAGRRMWGDGTDLDVMRKLALEQPPRLDTVVANTPKALVDLQSRLVARDASERPHTARAVAEELRAFVDETYAAQARDATREMMERLFAEQASRQRAALTEALQEVAPSHVDALRQSLEPLSPQLASQRSTMPEPVSGSMGVVSQVGKPRSGRARWLVAATLAVVTMGGVAAVAFGRRDGDGSSQGAVVTTKATQTQPAAPVVTMMTQTQAPGSTPPAVPSMSRAIAVPPRATAALTVVPTATPTATATAKPVTTKPPPNVDPKPF